MNLTKNMDGDDISGGAVTEYAQHTTRDKKEYEALDTFKKRWNGSPLDTVLDALVAFYATPNNRELTHILLSEKLLAIGSSLVASKKHQ